MKLKDYLRSNNISIVEFAVLSKISFSMLYNYFAERHKPRQPIAERIERLTNGQVTVRELRGIDEREPEVVD